MCWRLQIGCLVATLAVTPALAQSFEPGRSTVPAWAGSRVSVKRLQRDPQGKAVSEYAFGMMLLKRHDPNGARKWIARAVETDPDYTEALVALGIIEADRGDWTVSAKYFQRAVDSDATCYSAIINLAVTQLRLAQFNDAEETAQRALRIRPRDPTANFALAAAQYALNRLSPAAEAGLEKAARSLPAAEELLNAIEKERLAAR